MDIQQKYSPKVSEPKWLAFWEKERIYAFDSDSDKEVYSVDTPPPTVSGKMHIGHAFSFSQQDFIVRYQRMRGKNVFYPFGTDDNGLATIRLIEKLKNMKGVDMGRKEFVRLCLDTLKEITPDFVQDWKSIGISSDFSIYYSTIDGHCQRISQKSFIDLYKQGRIYRKRAPFIWCPECQTAIAQVEMRDKEQESQFVYMEFDTTIGERIPIATTRPELLPACVAVHVHPDDKRYKRFIGAKAKIPFSKREVEIVANKDADMEFGSGVVYHCTYGDMNDVEWIERFKIEPIEILNKNGTLNEKAGQFAGLHVKKARKAVIEALKNEGRIQKIEPIKHAVNVHERCDTDIEILTTDQWFIRYLDLKDEFLKQGKKMNWFPEHMRVRYDNWILGLKWDWNISRQRHFGVPIPAWYCKKCHEIHLPEESELPVDPMEESPRKQCKCGSKEFIGEKDTLDTWATSSLTPQLAIELMKGTKACKKLFPMSLRPQAHDIITFWLFNTVVKSCLHEKSVPWHNIMISGFALDPHGKKMSKSKGNVVSPQEMIAKYGADALRFWAAGSKLGDDLPFMEKDLVTGQKFITKLWNASNFAFINLKDYKNEKPEKLEAMDLWVLSKLSGIIKDSTETFEKYEYAKTKMEVENFFWHTFADNYLEIVKDRIYNPGRRGKGAREAAQWTLYGVLLSIVKMMAPITPYITEEVYQSYFKKYENEKSVHISSWPSFDMENERIGAIGDIFVSVLNDVRKAKSEKKVSMKVPVKRLLVKAKMAKEEFGSIKDDLKAVTWSEEVVFEQVQESSEISVETVVNL
ncbi:valine--tRNA ligase [Candidatus Woesearchaeota archaeon]|nr:valine--tRNA ligase [Candidatus Woesearchaeota archaeon]